MARDIDSDAVAVACGAASRKAADPAPLKLTLRDAVQMALKQNPQVQIANLNIAESQENQNVARSGLLAPGQSDRLGIGRRVKLAAAFGSEDSGLSRTRRALSG